MRGPVSVEGLLQGVDVELSPQFRPYLAHDLEVFQTIGTDIDAAEELPVQVAVEPFDKFSVGAIRIVLEEHQGDLAPGGEDRLRAFFRLLHTEGRHHVVPGHRPVDLAQIGFQKTVKENSQLFLLGGK
ncbi:hypothetical protein RQM65_16590 [Pricia sp. S334]|uniref:Uncharacterized protein n=1 Tax=Pricia mediterranea TaxID=3076079 RepID=A0ABU3L308_9FLAO|nr:hypothetical protein [Pricia sp. S334]MDT7827539.1 hypothetical protein [Pricia sp. S334]MDT7827686.1 hypothetical protein [Pricia sp. S334]MDT7829109.1 hypothetical protein [Pricia sp. S334]MDT7829800.1 hypothetical protein [Pricia sp. S334]MDT7830288.1 hypothetical protein [Pricia sp. S334]